MAGQRSARALPHNCIMSAAGYGTRAVNVTKISHGMNVVASDDRSRNGSAFYPVKRTSGSFGITVIYADHDDMEDFGKWMEAYCRRITNPDTHGLGPMRVTVATRKFDKIGVPNGEFGPIVSYGDHWDAVTYSQVVNFEGARDAIELSSPLLSFFRQATSGWEGADGSKHFYPSGAQQSGEAAMDISDESWYKPPAASPDEVVFIEGPNGRPIKGVT